MHLKQPFVFIICYIVGVSSNNDCAVHPFQSTLQPLIVLSGTDNFIYPAQGETLLKFASGQLVDIICPGRNIITNDFQTEYNLITVSCMSGEIFQLENNDQIKWRQLKCNNYPWRSIRYTGNKCAFGNGRELEVGFEISHDRFLQFFLICFNEKSQIAFYSYMNQTSSINQRILNNPRPSWIQGVGFYNIGKVTNFYLRKNQRKTINKLLGIHDRSTKYIKDRGNLFLARGHLTARSDGFYAAQQNATFFMQNIIPQWQVNNGFYWKQIETDVRNYAADNNADLQIWTGIHGTATLPHEITGEDVELFLFVNKTHKLLPVPELIWKVVYDPVKEEAVALIIVNNPYSNTSEPICKDISDQISWFNCKMNIGNLRLCYACNVDEFRVVVDVLPMFNVKNLLL